MCKDIDDIRGGCPRPSVLADFRPFQVIDGADSYEGLCNVRLYAIALFILRELLQMRPFYAMIHPYREGASRRPVRPKHPLTCGYTPR